jgi:cytochrome b561
MAEPGWSRAQRRLHWWTATLALANAPLGLLMVALPFSLLLSKFLAYQLHKSLGLTVLLLLAARLVLRALRGRPPHPADMPPWQHRAASAMHATLYALLLIVPLLGLLTAAAAPGQIPTTFFLLFRIPHPIAPNAALYPVLRVAHLALALALVGLALGHAGAALRQPGVLRRMWKG